MQDDFNWSDFDTILDVGCGTGALCSELDAAGMRVTGIDPAEKMLAIEKDKKENAGIDFRCENVLEGLSFDSDSFDLSICSYVAHGLSPEKRKQMYAETEMKNCINEMKTCFSDVQVINVDPRANWYICQKKQ
jgi:ubiquinone/menaquinone biosynthesis C-methylase UbiE